MTSAYSSGSLRPLCILISFHIIIIAASNYLVQIPVEIFGYFTTWGTFSFPLVYLATDLTVRIFGNDQAKKIVFFSMLPALVISYVFSILFFKGNFQGITPLGEFNTFVFRIAAASFTAYVLGQLVDIKIFSKLRKIHIWWIAPASSTIVGNLIDTIIFYSIAFWRSSDVFMAANWVEIGMIDYLFKLLVSLLLFVPLYGVLLRYLAEKIETQIDLQTTDGHKQEE